MVMQLPHFWNIFTFRTACRRLSLMVLLVAQYSPAAHEKSDYGECQHLVGNAAEVAATYEHGAHGFYKVAHGIDIRGEISCLRHGPGGRKQTRKQQKYDHEKPHNQNRLLHCFGVIGYD